MRFRLGLARSCAVSLVLSTASFASVSALTEQPARAETSPQVDALFKRGVEFYKEADFRAAVVEFKRAYEVSNKDYRVLYNIAQCEYQLTNYVGALNAFEKYLADGGEKIKEDKRSEVNAEIGKLKARIGTVTVKVEPAGAQVVVDGDVMGKAPLSEPVKLNPGSHKVEVTASGYERALESVEIGSGDVRSLDVKLKPTPIAPPPPTGDGEKNWTAPAVGWGVTGGLLAGTIVFGIVAKGKESALADAKALPNQDAATLKSLDSKVGTFALVTDIFLGATIVAAGVSTYLTIRTATGGGETKDAAKTGVRFVPTLGGGALVGSFQ
jgi:hypothetical protein